MNKKPTIILTGDSETGFTHLLYNNESLLKECLKSQRKQSLMEQIAEAKFKITLLENDYLSDKEDRQYRMQLINSWHEPKMDSSRQANTVSVSKYDIPIEVESGSKQIIPKWLRDIDLLQTQLSTLIGLLETRAVIVNRKILEEKCKNCMNNLIEIDNDIREADYLWNGKDVYDEYSSRVDDVSDLLSKLESYMEKAEV